MKIKHLKPEDPVYFFPKIESNASESDYPDGLIAIGGDLASERLLYAYRHGIFPWYSENEPIMWWSPNPRAVILPKEFHMSRSLAKRLRNESWSFSLNKDFSNVICQCAKNRRDEGTWITSEMISAYQKLHHLGYAHSFEAWKNGVLAGGIYGIRLGGVFFGESMFSAAKDGSKVALSALVYSSKKNGIKMIDCQIESDHLQSLGMRALDRADFLAKLKKYVTHKKVMPNWHFSTQSAILLTQLRDNNLNLDQ
ncbi:MAG: leucyl/phenylalanyl-tRNA--protein transferase [Pseudomonadota bacterium]|nr:leucyl/phenylalanyl-tRNA--protein transferase [Pseudomonadota bacterium]